MVAAWLGAALTPSARTPATAARRRDFMMRGIGLNLVGVVGGTGPPFVGGRVSGSLGTLEVPWRARRLVSVRCGYGAGKEVGSDGDAPCAGFSPPRGPPQPRPRQRAALRHVVGEACRAVVWPPPYRRRNR